MVVIGIDPGVNGGVAVMYSDTKVASYKMPSTEKDISDLFKEIYDYSQIENEPVVVFLEKVHSMPGQGVVSTFTFGMNYGFLRGTLIGLNFPIYDVTPQKWQKALGISKSESKAIHKNKLKGLAQQWFPDQKVTLKNADALLIAKYGKNQL